MGVFGTGGVLWTEGRDSVLRYRVGVPLTGVCFFWVEPVRVGVVGEFSGGGLLGVWQPRIAAQNQNRSYQISTAVLRSSTSAIRRRVPDVVSRGSLSIEKNP